jgi:hypothetical protein
MRLSSFGMSARPCACASCAIPSARSLLCSSRIAACNCSCRPKIMRRACGTCVPRARSARTRGTSTRARTLCVRASGLDAIASCRALRMGAFACGASQAPNSFIGCAGTRTSCMTPCGTRASACSPRARKKGLCARGGTTHSQPLKPTDAQAEMW